MYLVCRLLLEKKKKGVPENDRENGTKLENTLQDTAQENFPKAKIVPYKDAPECFSALQSDKGDAVVTNRSVASQLTAEQFNTCQTIKQISTGEEYAIAINQGNTKLKDDINQAIKDLTDDGTVDALMAKYNIK